VRIRCEYGRTPPLVFTHTSDIASHSNSHSHSHSHSHPHSHSHRYSPTPTGIHTRMHSRRCPPPPSATPSTSSPRSRCSSSSSAGRTFTAGLKRRLGSLRTPPHRPPLRTWTRWPPLRTPNRSRGRLGTLRGACEPALTRPQTADARVFKQVLPPRATEPGGRRRRRGRSWFKVAPHVYESTFPWPTAAYVEAWPTPAQSGGQPWPVGSLEGYSEARPNPPSTWRLSRFQPGSAAGGGAAGGAASGGGRGGGRGGGGGGREGRGAAWGHVGAGRVLACLPLFWRRAVAPRLLTAPALLSNAKAPTEVSSVGVWECIRVIV
jgi:hypothetical protein